jgi:hypothetical protein
MVVLEWMSLAVVGFLCGLFLGAGVGTFVFVVLVAIVATLVVSSSTDGGQLVFIVLTMGAGFVLVLGGGGLTAGCLLRQALANRRKRVRR